MWGGDWVVVSVCGVPACVCVHACVHVCVSLCVCVCVCMYVWVFCVFISNRFHCPMREHLDGDLRVESIIHCTHKQDVL